MRAGVVRKVALWAVVAALGATACTSDPPHSGPGRDDLRTSPAAAGPTPATPGSSSGTTPTVTSTASAGPATLTLAFAGDIHFADRLVGLLDDPSTSLRSLADTLGRADLAMANLETAITSRGAPEPKTYHFRTSPRALAALDEVGLDVLTMANNHAADYGLVGLRDTLAAKADSPVPVVGIGADRDEAFAPAVVATQGVRVAFFGSTQVPDLTARKFAAGADTPGVAVSRDVARLAAAVRKAAAAYDVVVVYLHWGTDYTTCPDGLQRSVATALEKAGADVILGSHAHRVQGAGWLGRAYVGYGLGNFVWYHGREPDARTGVLTLTVDAVAARSRGAATGPARDTREPLVTTASWTPMLVGSTGMPVVQTGARGAALLSSWKQARGCTGLRATSDR